jgi:hypothetical protein
VIVLKKVKAPIQKKETQKGTYFVSVRDHVAIRRTILESLRDMLDTLQKFHDFHQKRVEKAHKITQLRHLVNKTHKLVFRLKSTMPDVKLPAAPRQKKVEQAAAPMQSVSGQSQSSNPNPRPRASKPKSELDALEDELSMIEKKLSKLS